METDIFSDCNGLLFFFDLLQQQVCVSAAHFLCPFCGEEVVLSQLPEQSRHHQSSSFASNLKDSLTENDTHSALLCVSSSLTLLSFSKDKNHNLTGVCTCRKSTKFSTFSFLEFSSLFLLTTFEQQLKRFSHCLWIIFLLARLSSFSSSTLH